MDTWNTAITNLSVGKHIDYSKDKEYLQQKCNSKEEFQRELKKVYDREYRKKHRKILIIKELDRYHKGKRK